MRSAGAEAGQPPSVRRRERLEDVADLHDLSPAERRFLARVLGNARSLDPYTRGLFAEALVCESLGSGAELSKDPICPHDIDWNLGNRLTTIAVRCTGIRSFGHAPTTKPFAGSWSFPAKYGWMDGAWLDGDPVRCRADVAVLALHDGFDLASGWRFFVLPGHEVEAWPAKVLRPSTVAARFQSVTATDLPRAVRAAAKLPSADNHGG